MENNFEAIKLLLEKGANAALLNNRGTNVIFLMVKRDQVEMADVCLRSLSSDVKKKLFVNQTTPHGMLYIFIVKCIAIITHSYLL